MAASAAQEREVCLRHRDLPGHVHFELATERVERDVFQWPGDRDPGVVDEPIELFVGSAFLENRAHLRH